jgi:hypothetical protein
MCTWTSPSQNMSPSRKDFTAQVFALDASANVGYAEIQVHY